MKTVVFTIMIQQKDTAGHTYDQIAAAIVDALSAINIDNSTLDVQTIKSEDGDPRLDMREE